VPDDADHPNLLRRPAFEIYGHHYKPMLYFLWGLTPLISDIVGRSLMPTYDYLRIYREGDICRVHSDRQSCEHSLSLTLDYSDGALWPLDVGRKAIGTPSAEADDIFEDEEHYASGRCCALSRRYPSSWSHSAQSECVVGAFISSLGRRRRSVL
jgi:hypothetical protein